MGSIVSIFAEKPSIARALVRSFSIAYKLKFKGRKGKTRYNYIFETSINENQISFKIEKDEYRLKRGDQLIITSVSGHILNYEYLPPYDKESNWHNSDPLDMIELDPIEIPINKNLTDHVKEIGLISDLLIVATDWDGHGESIGRQILDLATQSNKKLQHGRMHFTSTNPIALKTAFENQTKLNWDLIKQVDSLRKQDLRMGSSLTRFLTVGVQKQGIRNQIISYGPCQTSVLWLITHRFLENKEFISKKFWKISLRINDSETPLFLDWKENPSYDETRVDTLISDLNKMQFGKITEYNEERGFIKRPLPLDTDTLEAECSQFFKISPKRVADIAEKLYNIGYITYPRTESSFYLQKDFTKLVEKFTSHEEFGSVAKECIVLKGVTNPSKGRYSKDHEPIMPVKAVTQADIAKAFAKTPYIINFAWQIYSYIVWRFLATVHKDVETLTQYITISVLEEEFIATGQRIIDPGFLKFYKYKTIRVKDLPFLEKDSEVAFQAFKHQGFTTPPRLWTESQLIRKMADLNLGTDATRSTHIDTVQKRQYTVIQDLQRTLIPTPLGTALYTVLTQNASELIIPEIRGKIESWTQQIRDHEKTPEDVDNLVINLTTRGLQQLKTNQDEIFSLLAQNIRSMTGIGKQFGICPECKGTLILSKGKDGSRFLKCSNPLCEIILPLPKKGKLTLIDIVHCEICNGQPLIVSSKYHSWIMCPICWTKEAKNGKPWFCNECNKKNCPFSGSWEITSAKQSLGSCPECQGEVFLEFNKEASNVVCSNCMKKWKAPKLRKGTSITISDPCSKCGNQTLYISKRGKPPYRLCVFCNLFFFNDSI